MDRRADPARRGGGDAARISFCAMRIVLGSALRIAVVLSTVVIAPAVRAQVGGGNVGGNGGGSTKPPTIDSVKLAEARALDPENPISFMLAHTTQLKLTENQATRMAAIQGELNRQNQDLRDRIDSIRPPGTPTHINFAGLTPAQRDSVLEARKALAATMGQMHDNSRRARTDAVALLTDEQQQRLTELERDMQNFIRDATYGSRNGDAGAGKHSTTGSNPPY
jgi:hypothetical protein